MKTKFINYVAAVIAIALAAAFCFPVSADEPPKKRKTREEIAVETEKMKVERSLPAYVEAVIDYDMQIIEMTCYGLSQAEVYIVDSLGQIFSTRTINSDTDPSVVLEAPTAPGTYWLVIMSDNYYGEGEFSVI